MENLKDYNDFLFEKRGVSPVIYKDLEFFFDSLILTIKSKKRNSIICHTKQTSNTRMIQANLNNAGIHPQR